MGVDAVAMDMTLARVATERMEGLASAYLAALMQAFDTVQGAGVGWSGSGECRAGGAAEEVVNLLCHRRFSHLSQTQASRYRPAMLERLQADVDAARPLRFFYDLGGGYHASLQSDFSGLRFAPGLGELLALRQIRWLAQAVDRVYPPGLHFSLVIDDLCAWAANGIALDKTQGYGARLRTLIGAVQMADTVDVLAESALCTSAHFQEAVEGEPATAPTRELSAQALENVCRFVGRACTPTEALAHLARYQRAQAGSDRLLAPHILGVRLTQRATPSCLGFRYFPGGDSRLQAGAVVLALGAGGDVRPMLFTSRNQNGCTLQSLPTAVLPLHWPLAAGDAQVALRRRTPLQADGAGATVSLEGFA
jgi:hypothetical protein